jgi:hypothetical protein
MAEKSSRKGSRKMIEHKKLQQEALEEYKETRDIIKLQKRLGHKNIRSTFDLLGKHKLL